VDGLLNGKRYLIHDRDPLFTAEFLSTLAEADVASVKLPPRSGLLNYYYRNTDTSPNRSDCTDRVRNSQEQNDRFFGHYDILPSSPRTNTLSPSVITSGPSTSWSFRLV
jgi:hypothetical protein